MLIRMDWMEVSSYIEKVLGYDEDEAECLADFFYNTGWDGIDIRRYLENSVFYIISPNEDVGEYIKKGDSEDYSIIKSDNGYTYLEFY